MFLIPLHSVAVSRALVVFERIGKSCGVAAEREVVACIWSEHHRA